MIGTIIGAIVAVAISAAINEFGLGMAWQIALAVAICAAFARGHPEIEVCLWTPPIILMTAAPTESIVSVASYRSCEVILGVVVGGLLHVVDKKFVAWAN